MTPGNDRETAIAAIMFLGFAMASADGRMTKEEIEIIKDELKLFDVSDSELIRIENKSKELKGYQALSIVASLVDDLKKQTILFLCRIMFSDGKIEEKEQKMLYAVAKLANIPSEYVWGCEQYCQMENFKKNFSRWRK